MRRLYCLLIVTLMICGLFPRQALKAEEKGFFGVEMGDNLSGFMIDYEVFQNLYRLKTVPQPDKKFPAYIARFHVNTGVCMVTGSTWPTKTNKRADQLKEEFDAMVLDLAERFGEATVAFHVLKGSSKLWREDFMTKLSWGEGVLTAKWSYTRGSIMDDQVREVLLMAKSNYFEEGFFNLQIKFNNYEQCIRFQHQDIQKKINLK